MENSVFKNLSTLDLNNKIKAIQGNRYLPWTEAWSELCKLYPNSTFEFHENNDGIPYFNSPLGLFVKVSVTVKEITHTIHRPVYDFRNLAMKTEPYQVKYGKKTVDVNAATANDVNDSLMRALTKAIALHGLGIYIFQDKQYADAELLDSSQISEISNLIAKHKLMLSDLNAVFGINKLSELMAINFQGALQWIEDNKNATKS